MHITVKGKNLDVGDSLRQHVESHLAADVGKYFSNPLTGTVTVSREAHRFRADIAVHVGREIHMQGRGEADDAYAAVNAGLDRIAKQLRRYKRRLEGRHKAPREAEPALVPHYVLATEDEAAETSNGHPPVVAEIETPIATLTVSDAVMHMDLADQPVLMFRNRAHGGLNVVYRRTDGTIGWIDPDGGAASKKP